MREVTTRANKLMHPNEADHTKMLAFIGGKVGEIEKITSTDMTTPDRIVTYPFRITWSDGILSPTYDTLVSLVTNLENRGVKFYHL